MSPDRVDDAQPRALRLRFRDWSESEAWAVAAALSSATPWLRSLEFAAHSGDVGMFALPLAAREAHLRGLLESTLPSTDIRVVDAPCVQRPFVGWEVSTRVSDALPLSLRSPRQFDFPSSLVRALADDDVTALFQIVVEPEVGQRWRNRAFRDARYLIVPEPSATQRAISFVVPGLSSGDGAAAPRWLRDAQRETADRAALSTLLRTTIRFAATAQRSADARRVAEQAWQVLQSAFADGVNGVQLAPIRDPDAFADRLVRRALGTPIVLSPDEMAASIWHPPLRSSQGVAGLQARTLVVNAPREARLGETRLGRDPEDHAVLLRLADRRSHALVCGATGAGKSTYILNQIIADIEGGRGVCLIDPKGDAIESVLARFPERRADDLIVFDPSRAPVVSFNALAPRAGASPDQITDDVTEALRQLHPDAWGVRIERVVRNAVAAVQTLPAGSLVELHPFLVDAPFRRKALTGVRDPFVLRFWRDEFDALSPSQRQQWVEPVLHRLQPFLGNPLVRRALSGSGGLDLRAVMDRGRVLLADLSQGRLGGANAFVFAHLLISGLKRAALSRVDTPEDARRDFYLYVDEAHAAAPTHFVKMLSECRAVRLDCTLCTQFLHQLPHDVVEALLANVGQVIAFRLGEPDARLLAARFAPEFGARHLIALDNYMAAARLVSGGKVLSPFTLFTDQLPPERGVDWARLLREASLRRYASVEDDALSCADVARIAACDEVPPEVEWQST